MASKSDAAEPTSPEQQHVRIEAEAAGDARIGVIGGVIHGDATVYQYAGEDPEELFKTGLNNLRAGAPREAERLIRDAFSRGFTSNRVCFYYALAAISRRTIGDLDEALDVLEAAFNRADLAADDVYGQGLNVISGLVGCLLEDDLREALPKVHRKAAEETRTERLDDAVNGFEALPENIREEVRRHLTSILAGVIQDRLDVTEAETVTRGRTANRRKQRAILFFLPDPAEPVERTVRLDPPSRKETIGVTVSASCIAAGLGVLVLVGALSGSQSQLVLCVLLVMSAAVATRGIDQTVTWHVVRSRGDSYTRDLVVSENDMDAQERIFRAHVRRSCLLAFSLLGRDDADGGTEWLEATAGTSTALRARIINCYLSTQLETPTSLEWSIGRAAFHARKAWEQAPPEAATAPRPPRIVVAYAAAALTSISLIGLAANTLASNPGRAFGALLLLVVGAALGIWYCLPLYGDWCWTTWDRRRAATEYEEDAKAHQRAREVLADRPTDLEMAQWLDFDLRWLRLKTLQQHRMTNKDLVDHLVLTDAAPFAMRALVHGGPARYSAYMVQLFLLSEGGVRQSVTRLHTLTGDFGHQRRLGFGYKNLASAHVEKVGTRFSMRSRTVEVLGAQENEKSPGAAGQDTPDIPPPVVPGEVRSDVDDPVAPSESDEQDVVIPQEAFRLRLVDGTHLDVLIDNSRLWADELTDEAQQRLEVLSRETSGIDTAMHLLEAVAVDGSAWLKRRRSRSLRNLREQAQRARPESKALRGWAELSGAMSAEQKEIGPEDPGPAT